MGLRPKPRSGGGSGRLSGLGSTGLGGQFGLGRWAWRYVWLSGTVRLGGLRSSSSQRGGQFGSVGLVEWDLVVSLAQWYSLVWWAAVLGFAVLFP